MLTRLKLTGGILVDLMLHIADRNKLTGQDRINCTNSNLAEPEFFKLLYIAITGAQLEYSTEGTLKKDFSNYKTCKSAGTRNVPLNDVAVCNTYKKTVACNYNRARNRAIDFINKCISPTEANMTWLVSSVIQILAADESTNQGKFLYITPNGQPITFPMMQELQELDFASFIVGIICYVLTYEPTTNETGKYTYDQIHRDANTFVPELGYIEQYFSVNFDPTMQDERTTATNTNTEKSDSNGNGAVNNYFNRPTIVNQYGANSTHIDYVENLKL